MYKINKDQISYIHERTEYVISKKAEVLIHKEGLSLFGGYTGEEVNIIRGIIEKHPDVETKISTIVFIDKTELNIPYKDGKVFYEII